MNDEPILFAGKTATNFLSSKNPSNERKSINEAAL
jgi:hypothetical protein